MLKKSPSKTMLNAPIKTKKSTSREREKKKKSQISEASTSSSADKNQLNMLYDNDKNQLNMLYDNDKKYSGFGSKTVQCIAEQFTNEQVDDDIAKTLAEDLTYKLHEVLQTASVNMRQGKRKYLKVDDVSAAFKRFNIERVYGAAESNWMTFEDPNDYSFIPEKPLNLLEIATSELHHTKIGDVGLDYKWLKDTSIFNQLLVNNSLNSYSQKIMNAAVSSKQALKQQALKDVAKNINIGPIIPHLCNFCFLVLQKNITYSSLAAPVLQLLEAIMFNPCTSYSVEEKQMTLLIYLLLENIMNASNDTLDEVIPICRTLGRLCIQWSKGDSIVVEKVKKYLLPEEPIRRLSAPVICALTYLGNYALNALLWPHIDAMFECLKNINQLERSKLHTSLLSAASLLYRQEEWNLIVHEVLCEEFGDALVPLWKSLEVPAYGYDTCTDNSAQTNWFNIKKTLLKTLKLHSQQSIANRTTQFKIMFREAKPPSLTIRTLQIVGYKALPIKKRRQLKITQQTYNSDVTRIGDSVNIITGRRTLFTLKKTFSVNNTKKSNNYIRDFLYMML